MKELPDNELRAVLIACQNYKPVKGHAAQGRVLEKLVHEVMRRQFAKIGKDHG